MRKITEETEVSIVKENIISWQKFQFSQITDLFHQYFPKGNAANTGYGNQFSRLLGIDFGQIHNDFKFFIKELNTENIGSKSVAMVNAVKAGSKFTLYFETKDETGVTYYESSIESSPQVYNVLPDVSRSLNKRYGVSSELRNQFVYNWALSPASILGDLFYTRAIPKSISDDFLAETVNTAFPRNESLVRAEKYHIRGENLRVLKALIEESEINHKNIGIRFGVNPSDFLVGTDMFTMIVELKPVLNNIEVSVEAPMAMVNNNIPDISLLSNLKFESENEAFKMTLGRNGVSLECAGINYHNDYGQQIEAVLKNDWKALFCVMPGFVEIIVIKKDTKTSEFRGGRVNLMIQSGSSTVISEKQEIAFGETTYLEFVQACPPFCDGE